MWMHKHICAYVANKFLSPQAQFPEKREKEEIAFALVSHYT